MVKECIRKILRDNLTGVQYDPEQSPILSKTLADTIKDKLKGEVFWMLKMKDESHT